MTHRRSVAASLLLLALVLPAGCSRGHDPTYTVTGTVRVDGKILNGGSVIFETIEPGSDGKVRTARAAIQSDGNYRLTTFAENDGAMAGRHRVAVMATSVVAPEKPLPPAARILPRKYASTVTSGLEFEVKPEPNMIDIELSSK